MADVMLEQPNVHVFWSAYDPLDLASDSIDPLGFMASYIALADRILPGLTTITTVPRYASMLCHALRLARNAVGNDEGHNIATRRQQIIDRLTLFERAWGLACGLAEQDRDIGAKATDGLRGIRAVHTWLDLNASRVRLGLTFALLSNQVRYGGIGAYSTLLESLHLADMRALTLRPLGEQLADAFPAPKDFDLDVLREGAPLSTQDLRMWGRQAHAGSLSTTEARLLRHALRGGDEAELDDHTRWTMLQYLGTCASDGDTDEPRLLASCLSTINHDATALGHVGARLIAGLQIIEQYERMYQCALFVFDRIRAGASGSGHARLSSLVAEQPFVDACGQMGKAAASLLTQADSAAGLHGDIGDAKRTLQATGLIELARTLSEVKAPIDCGHRILERHQSVQGGKFDGGLPKGPWVRLDAGRDLVARLTAQRFGLDPSQAKRSWRDMPRHPYRTFGALRFIKQCRIQ
jgi:hypothetical protein